MYPRLISINTESSALILGPRGTGKTSWIKNHFKEALYLDLLESETYNDLLANPSNLKNRIPKETKEFIIIDEIQKIPELLNEVHRLIETYKYKFVLTGSSARSLRRKGVNLLAGRALNYNMHPLTCYELGDDFSLEKSLKFGLLPSAYKSKDPAHYLETYLATYLKEEVLQEGLLRNLGEFARFLEVASFSQGGILNYSNIAREAAIDRRVVSSFFEIVEDLLIGYKLSVFTKRAKRRLVSHPKFYFFDSGIYRTLRPRGPLDTTEEIDGAALETLLLAHLRAVNDYYRLGYKIYYWHTSNDVEVDFVLYGEKGLFAFEIKRTRSLSRSDLHGLRAFAKDYEVAKLFLFYGGDHDEYYDNIHVMPFEKGLLELRNILGVQESK